MRWSCVSQCPIRARPGSFAASGAGRTQLGFHRIWSTDWFRNPARELDKLVGAIDKAKARPQSLHPVPVPVLETKPIILDAAEAPTVPIALPPKYKCAELHIKPQSSDLHLVEADQLSEWLAQVVTVESPIFWLEATRRVAAAVGIQRIGNRIQDAFQRACTIGSRSGRFSMRAGFLWRTGITDAPVRDRSDLAPSSRKIEYIAPEGNSCRNRTRCARQLRCIAR